MNSQRCIFSKQILQELHYTNSLFLNLLKETLNDGTEVKAMLLSLGLITNKKKRSSETKRVKIFIGCLLDQGSGVKEQQFSF